MNSAPFSSIDSGALDIVRQLTTAGFSAYLAGGCVRDYLLNRAPKDFDIATNAPPDTVERLFPQSYAVGKKFGVIVVRLADQNYEVATFRTDLEYADGRHPASVEFSTPQEDANRRDFTINGLFYDTEGRKILDYVNGREDLDKGIIRAIGDAEDRFREDHLRILRAARFASVLGFSIDPGTASAARTLAPSLLKVSKERIRDELTRLLTESPRAGDGLQLLHELEILSVILPEIETTIGQEQPPEYHPEGDVFTHTRLMLNMMNTPAPLRLAYAVLLHDVAKPLTATTSADKKGVRRIRFNGHAAEGAVLAERILKRLALSTGDIEAVAHCVRNHMSFINVPDMKVSTLRRFIGTPEFETELELHRLDCLASHGSLERYDFIMKFRADLASSPPLPKPWITGRDIIALGVPEGPEVGFWVAQTYDRQLENAFANPDEVIEWLKTELAKKS